MPIQGMGKADRVPWRLLTWGVILGFVVLRNFNALVYPILFGEDGTHLFMYYMENRDLDSLLREYAGYVSFGANGMGWLIGSLPIVWQPYVLAANAALIAAGCLGLFTSERFDEVLPDLRARCALCVCLAILPVGNFALMTCTMFVNWHLLFAVCLLALAAPPRTRWGSVVEAAFVWLCLWTNPLGIVLVPVYIVRAWCTERSSVRLVYVFYVVLAVLYQALFVTHGGSAEAGEAPIGSVLHAAWRLASERVLTEPFVGTTGEFQLQESGLPFVTLLPALAIGLFVFVRSLHLPEPTRPRLGAVGYLVVSMTLAVAFARFNWLHDMLHWGHRYTYVQKLLVYFAVAVVALSTCRRTGLWITVLLLHAVVLAWFDGRPYQVSKVRGQRVMQFVRDAAAWRADPSAGGQLRSYDEVSRQLVIRRAPAASPR